MAIVDVKQSLREAAAGDALAAAALARIEELEIAILRSGGCLLSPTFAHYLKNDVCIHCDTFVPQPGRYTNEAPPT